MLEADFEVFPADLLSDDVLADPVALTRALVDIPSVSGDEQTIADAVQAVLAATGRYSIRRFGNTLAARTELGRDRRVILAGHLDTVPIADNLPASVTDERITGCGTADMKSGVALALHLAATLGEPRYDLTYLFYDCEEVRAERNGLNKLAAQQPDLLTEADLAILLEPSYGLPEAGCQGTMRVVIKLTGRRAHTARSWLGVNAIHAAAPVLARLAGYTAREVTLEGCTYREGLNAVKITGGVAGNVLPDECELAVNYRFAPDRDIDSALAHLREVFDGYPLELVDSAPAAPPGLDSDLAREFLAAVGEPPRAKLGWTDVARFAALGVPALNYGPGDPNLAHTREEYVEIDKIRSGAAVLRRWLSRQSP